MYIRTYVRNSWKTLEDRLKQLCIYIYMYISEQQNRLRATHVAIIKNMKQDVLTWRSLSTAGYKVYLKLTKTSGSTAGYKVYLKLTKTSGSKCPVSYIATCVARKRFCCSFRT